MSRRDGPYRGVVALPGSGAAAAGEGARRSMFPIYDAYIKLTTRDDQEAFSRTVMRNIREHLEQLVAEMNTAVPNQDVDAMYAWGKANGHNIDYLMPQDIAGFRKGETDPVYAHSEISRGRADVVVSGAGIPLERVLPPEAGGAAGEPSTGGRRHRRKTRKTRRHTRRRR